MSGVTDTPSVAAFAGVKLHLETDQIAVWEEHFAPQQLLAPHRHGRDYIAIALTDLDLSVEPVAGEAAEQLTFLAGEEKASFEGPRGRLPAGVVFYSRVGAKGAAHTAFNNADETARIMLIEIKGTGAEADRAG